MKKWIIGLFSILAFSSSSYANLVCNWANDSYTLKFQFKNDSINGFIKTYYNGYERTYQFNESISWDGEGEHSFVNPDGDIHLVFDLGYDQADLKFNGKYYYAMCEKE